MNILMQELFATDSGLLSVFIIVFVIGMSVFFSNMIKKNMAKDEAAQANKK